MKRLLKESSNKNYVNEIIIKEFAGGIFPFNNLYVVCDGDMKRFANDFKNDLKPMEIHPLILSEGMEDEFKLMVDEGDCLLAVSQLGRDGFIENIIKIALKNNVEVYGVCGDFRSGLALLCDDTLIIEEDFDINAEAFLKAFCQIILDNLEDKTDYIIDNCSVPFVSRFQGVVKEINVFFGDEIKLGDKVCVMDAMKMEFEVCSDLEGIVVEILVRPGDVVYKGQSLIRVI